MGAQIIGLYLRKEGVKAREVVDGAALYGTPWSSKGADYLYNNMFGFYQNIIGTNLSKDTHKMLP